MVPVLLLGAFALGAFALASRSRAPSPAPPAAQPPLSPAESALLAKLDPSAQAFVLQVLRELRAAGLAPQLVSGRRTCAEQNALYAKGRTTAGPVVTQARGCQSWHVAGRAVDVQFPRGTPEQYAQLGAIAKNLGGKWGGDFPGFPDVGHIEFHPGLRIEDVCPNPDNCSDH